MPLGVPRKLWSIPQKPHEEVGMYFTVLGATYIVSPAPRYVAAETNRGSTVLLSARLPCRKIFAGPYHGWTYEQVYFECYVMYRAECTNLNWTICRAKKMETFPSSFAMKSRKPDDSSGDLCGLIHNMSEFSNATSRFQKRAECREKHFPSLYGWLPIRYCVGGLTLSLVILPYSRTLQVYFEHLWGVIFHQNSGMSNHISYTVAWLYQADIGAVGVDTWLRIWSLLEVGQVASKTTEFPCKW